MKVYRYERNGVGPFRGASEEEIALMDEHGSKGWTTERISVFNQLLFKASLQTPPIIGSLCAMNILEELKSIFGEHGEKYLISIGFCLYEYEGCIIKDDNVMSWIDVTKPYTKRKI